VRSVPALLRAPGDFAALPAAMMPLLRSRIGKRRSV